MSRWVIFLNQEYEIIGICLRIIPKMKKLLGLGLLLAVVQNVALTNPASAGIVTDKKAPIQLSTSASNSFVVETECCESNSECRNAVSITGKSGVIDKVFIDPKIKACPKKPKNDDSEFFKDDVETTSLKLDANTSGLLLKINRCPGGDECNWAHYVYVASNGKLKQAWKYEGMQPAMYYSTEVAVSKDKSTGFDQLSFRGQLTMTRGYKSILKDPPASWTFDETPDEFSFSALKWNAKQQRIVESNPKVFLLILDSKPDFSQAFKAKLGHWKTCDAVEHFLVLATDKFKSLTKNLFVVAYASADKADVEEMKKKVEACNPKIASFIKESAQ